MNGMIRDGLRSLRKPATLLMLFTVLGAAGTARAGDDVYQNLAFVLLSRAEMPQASRVSAELGALEPDIRVEAASEDGALALTLSDSSEVFISLVPVAIPEGEAEQGVPYSVSSLFTGWKLPEYHAHLVVVFRDRSADATVVRLSRFTSIVASVMKASGALGVYWGSAGATHAADYFLSVAYGTDEFMRLTLWTGVSVAQEKSGGLSFLSLGMQQVELPNLYLKAGGVPEDEALGVFFDLLGYVVDRGAALPDGDTVGRSADEILEVHYVPAPAGDGERVWRVELR